MLLEGLTPVNHQQKNVLHDLNQWNHMHIRCVSNQITVSINDEIVNRDDLNKGATDKRLKHRVFAFQDHAYAVWLKHQDFEHRVHSFQ